MAPVFNMYFYERSGHASRSRSPVIIRHRGRSRDRSRDRSSGRRRNHRSPSRRVRQRSIRDRAANYDSYTPYPPVESTQSALALQDVSRPPGDFTGSYSPSGPAAGPAPMTPPTPASPPPLPPPPTPPQPTTTPPPGYHTFPPPGHLSAVNLPPPPPPLLPQSRPKVIPPPQSCGASATTHAAPPSDSNACKTVNVFSKAASQLTGFLSGHAQQAGALVAVAPAADSSVLGPPSDGALLDDVNDPNTGKAASDSYPEQLPGESNLAYSIRIADAIPLNYEWAQLGAVPPAPVPRGLFASFQYSSLRTMLQRKQFTQADFDSLASVSDDDTCRVRQWLYELLSTYGPVHEHKDNVLHNFARVLHVLGLQPQSIFTLGQAFQTNSGRVVWVLQTKNFPGPSLQRATGDEPYQFFHMTSTQGLLGILKLGTILPSANDRIGLPEDFPSSAFFSLLKHTYNQMSARDIALQCAKLFQHSKQQSGVMLSGCILGGHTKYKWSSTWVEMALASRAGLVRSKSSDKRWAIRVDLAQIQWVVLMS